MATTSSAPPQPSLATQTTVVTVSYGNRWPLLRQALDSARGEGIGRVVVVDNGSRDDVQAQALQTFGPDFCDVVVMGRNTGSAAGFKRGIERAMAGAGEFLLLLDDDNVLEPGCVAALHGAWQTQSQAVAASKLAVLAYRRDRMVDAATLGRPVGGEPTAFFGFHWSDVPFKLYRRLPLVRRALALRPARSEIVMSIAPYSGMLFHRSVIEAHGLPDERFVLYADDTEFSYRLTRGGGKIVLVTEGRITDLEPSWSTKSSHGNTFDALLCGSDDFRAFYSTRNNAYYERWARERGASASRRLNRMIFLAVLGCRARMLGRMDRLRLLRHAMAEGEAGRLGVDAAFPLR
ncbi:MAG: glycosyltransferase [Rhizobacter sp.]|nr:glycosyltransferase [Rhizobacter sp.]